MLKNPIALTLTSIMLVVSMLLGVWNVRAQQASLHNETVADTEQIQATIQAYFDLRYRSHSTLQLEDFRSFIDGSTQGDAFLRAETDKLEIELRHAQIYQLRYVEYDFSLDFTEIAIDASTQTATAFVTEGHDVVFEIVEDVFDEPIVSSMRNLEHTITLHEENGIWKIVSDNYEDYLWRLLNSTGLSKDELLHSLDTNNALPISIDSPSGIDGNCYFPPDESSRAYDRSSAVDYAHLWATAAPPYNPDYYDFTNEGGDCTNFVSQAVYEGGGGVMIGEDTYGWYYNSVSDYASAWTGVGFFYQFVTGYDVWSAGPEGCDIDKDNAEIGDVIQYDWDNNGDWDHSVIIVFSEDMGYGDMYHLIAAHTDDLDNYPFTHFLYVHPNMVYRFLHIDRIDGYFTYLSLVQQSSGVYHIDQYLDPYPAPIDITAQEQQSLQPQPYPSP